MILSMPARGVQGEAGTALCRIGRGQRRSEVIDCTGRVSPEDKDGQRKRDVEEASTDGWTEDTREPGNERRPRGQQEGLVQRWTVNNPAEWRPFGSRLSPHRRFFVQP